MDSRREVTRTYFKHKIRGIDWSNDGDKVVIADARAKLYLFNSQLTHQYDEYTGKPYDFNKS